MISEAIVQQLAEFASENNYEAIRGELIADIESPDEYELGDEINILIHPSGRYMFWYLSELQQCLFGIYDDGHGRCKLNIPTANFGQDELLACINGICARVMG